MKVAACACAVGVLFALGFAEPTSIAQGAGFVSIFNGKDLTGWKVPEVTTATGRSSMP